MSKSASSGAPGGKRAAAIDPPGRRIGCLVVMAMPMTRWPGEKSLPAAPAG
jgi:hypothetical protein